MPERQTPPDVLWRKGRRCRPSFLLMFQLLREPSGVELVCLALGVLSAGLCIHCLLSSFSSSSLPFFLSLSLVAIFSCDHGSSRIQSKDFPLLPPFFLPQESVAEPTPAETHLKTQEAVTKFVFAKLPRPSRLESRCIWRKERKDGEEKKGRRDVKDHNITELNFQNGFIGPCSPKPLQIHSGKLYPEVDKFKKYCLDHACNRNHSSFNAE